MNRAEIAVNKFKEGYNCAQSVVFAYSEEFNISKNELLKMANGFGGGMGRKQEVCGAITGGIIVLGLIYGRGENEDKSKQKIVYSKVREFIDKFESKNETINCKKLLDECNLMTPDGQNIFKSKSMIEKCYNYVEDAVEILEDIIKRE